MTTELGGDSTPNWVYGVFTRHLQSMDRPNSLENAAKNLGSRLAHPRVVGFFLCPSDHVLAVKFNSIFFLRFNVRRSRELIGGNKSNYSIFFPLIRRLYMYIHIYDCGQSQHCN
jgi:hypothetical protein